MHAYVIQLVDPVVGVAYVTGGTQQLVTSTCPKCFSDLELCSSVPPIIFASTFYSFLLHFIPLQANNVCPFGHKFSTQHIPTHSMQITVEVHVHFLQQSFRKPVNSHFVFCLSAATPEILWHHQPPNHHKCPATTATTAPCRHFSVPQRLHHVQGQVQPLKVSHL